MPSTQINGNLSYSVFKGNVSASNISKIPALCCRRTEVDIDLGPLPGLPKLAYIGNCNTQKQLRIDELTLACANYFNTIVNL